jgi:hypothetical protein
MDGHQRPADLAAQLATLAHRVDRLSPSHGDPERFFEERDEISRELQRLSRGG